jgi:nucleoside 2-deoxyribosyltransferase
MKMCPLCFNEKAYVDYIHLIDAYEVNCMVCGGNYIVTADVLNNITDLSERTKISVLLKERSIKGLKPLSLFLERPKVEVTNIPYAITTVSELISKFPKNVLDRIDRTLINLSLISKYPGEIIEITEEERRIFFTQSNEAEEFLYMLKQLLDDGLVIGDYRLPTKLYITVKGWKKIAELQKNFHEDYNQVFVAMCFKPEMEKPYINGIKKAIEDCDYRAIRIDKVEHNNKIDDKIIAEIKKSKFIVADFTWHRGGVYFEAGFAMGLGKPVIWTCRQDHLSEIHFDTRQYSHIVWENESDLYHKLYNRIRATIN